MALVIAGVVFLSANALFSTSETTTDQVIRRAGRADRIANGSRLLRQLFAETEASDSVHALRGDARKVRFDTWCRSAEGWQERCKAIAGFDSIQGRRVLAVVVSPGPVVALSDDFGEGRFIYLADPQGGGRWVADWRDVTKAPRAIGVVRDRDTMIVRVGP